MSDFVPRLTDSGIRGNPYWYADNQYYKAGYGMPNCTAYALGRWYELQGSARPFAFPGYWNGKDWYEMGISAGYQSSRTVPQLGAAASWDYGEAGHVAIVESIDYDAAGQPTHIITSNSAYGGTYFWIQDLYASNGWQTSWATGFNGFIYHPDISPRPTPPGSLPLPLQFLLMSRKRKQSIRRRWKP